LRSLRTPITARAAHGTLARERPLSGVLTDGKARPALLALQPRQPSIKLGLLSTFVSVPLYLFPLHFCDVDRSAALNGQC
jgi:hypothetical protein